MIAKRAVFLDRDGVLNRNVFNPGTGEYESPGKPEDFELSPNVIPALSDLQAAGYLLFLVSNQPNFAKGKSTLEELRAIHSRLLEAVEPAGIKFTACYYCFHHPHGSVAEYSGWCECRKPSPYFLNKAGDEFDLSLSDSWMVGDRATDIECGAAAGVRTIRVAEDYPVSSRPPDEQKPHHSVENLADAASIILDSDTRGKSLRP